MGVSVLCAYCANVLLPSNATAATPRISAKFAASTTRVSVSGRLGHGTVRAAPKRSAWRVVLEEKITSGKRSTWVVRSHAALRSKAGTSTFAMKWTVPAADRGSWLTLRLEVLAGRVVVTRSATKRVRLQSSGSRSSEPSGPAPTQPSQPAPITGPAIWKDEGAGLTPVTPISGQLAGLTEDSVGGVWTVYPDGTANLEVHPWGFAGSSLPLQMSLSGVASVTGGSGEGGRAVLILKTDGTVWTEGDGSWGQLGNGTQGTGDYSATPVQVPGLSGITQVATADGETNYALKVDGTVWGWGQGGAGGLGNGSGAIVSSPIQIPGLSNVVWIAGGGGPDGFAVESNGTVWAWGCEANGIHGDGPNDPAYYTVHQVPGLSGITRVFLGGLGNSTVFAIGVGGQVWAWGWDQWDATGTDPVGSVGSQTVYFPTLVPNVSDAVAAGYDLILRGDGRVYDWSSARGRAAVAPALASTPTGATLLSGSYVFVP